MEVVLRYDVRVHALTVYFTMLYFYLMRFVTFVTVGVTRLLLSSRVSQFGLRVP